MGKKQQNDHRDIDRVEVVLELLRKQAPLSVEQEKFCNYACVERFLKSKGYNVKKAAKQLRTCLSWRQSIITDLMADEFSAELAEGVAYVAGHDDESRPVLIFRIKQDCQKFHSQKLFARLLVFTLEVAIGTMAKNVEQLVLLFDAMSEIISDDVRSALMASYIARIFKGHFGNGSFYRSASGFMNLFLLALKIVAEYYPGRLYRAFVLDPPSLFSYLWKGVRPFVELSVVAMVLCSFDFEESLDLDDFAAYPRTSSLRFKPASMNSTAKIESCSSSSRFAFTVSHHFDPLKPWYLSLTDTPDSEVGPVGRSPLTLSPTLISPLNSRSQSFASPTARTPSTARIDGGSSGRHTRESLFPSTPLPQRSPKTKMAFLQSPALFFRKESHVSKTERCRESFMPYLKFNRRPYDEKTYRSKMKPPLGGLISVVSPQLRRRHMSVSQRF